MTVMRLAFMNYTDVPSVPSPSDFDLAFLLQIYCRDARQWRRGVLNRLQPLDWQAVVRDVRPFLEEPSELGAFTTRTVRAMIEK